ncbi:MAG: efflux RND transporter periplasmic adaptor subunit [Pseudomonadota bacterium]
MLLADRRRSLLIGAAAIALCLLFASLWVSDEAPPAPIAGLFSPVTHVTEAPFEVRVTALAELDASHSVLLSSALPSNRGKAVFLVPEGELVQAGDTVARFDATPFKEDIEKIGHDIRDQQIKLDQARADLALHETGSADRVAELEHQLELASLKLQTLDQGSIPLRTAQAEKEERRTRAERDKARKLLATETELFDKGLTREKSLFEAKEAAREAQAAFELAQHQLRVLNEVTLPSERRQAELQLANREREVEVYRQTYADQSRKQAATIAQIENKIAALEADRERSKDYLGMTELTAPVSGLVIYKTISIQGEKRKVQVGDSLWQRQGFAVIPDLSSLVAHMNISETEVGKLAPGQGATIRPEAYPALRLMGAVDVVGTLAARDEAQGTRSFRVRIDLENGDARLRPGMSARASVLVERFDSALLLPVEAIFYHEQQPVVFLWHDGEPERVPVTLGLGDGRHVVVSKGVDVGAEVMLVYPERFPVANHAAR